MARAYNQTRDTTAATAARLKSGRNYSTLGPGVHLSHKGYIRISSGPNRNKFAHRVVMAGLASVWCYYPLNPSTGLPDGFDVEHQDHRRAHNCHQNLILIDHTIHCYLSVASRECRRSLDDWDADGDWVGRKSPKYTDTELAEVPF
jgi:hypothetical protein